MAGAQVSANLDPAEGDLVIPGAPARAAGGGVQLVQSAALIRAPLARTTYSVNGAGLSCALIDSGARVSHVDFDGRILAQRNFTTDDGGDPLRVTDGNGHGTNAAGVVAANGVHTGIAPGAGLVILKAATNAGNVPRVNTGAALQWVLDNHRDLGISVVNMSLGDGENYLRHELFVGDPFGINAKIQQLRALNIAVVVSAGNGFAKFRSSQGMSWPAIRPETVSVGAVYDSNVGRDELEGGIATATGPNRITPYSQRLHESVNSVDRTDIFAPGALMTSAGNSGDQASSTFHGTSEAAPVISGLLMLMQEKARAMTGALPTVDKLEQWLRAGAVPITDGDDEVDNVQNTGKIFLRADALGAMEQLVGDLGGPILTDCAVAPRNLPSAGGTVTFSVDAADLSGVASVTAVATGGTGDFELPMPLVSGSTYRATRVEPANSGAARTYTVSVRALDQAGHPTTVDCGTYTVAGSPLPRISVSSTRLTVSSRRSVRIRIKNSGGGTLTGNIQEGRGTDVSPSSFTLAAGRSRTVRVRKVRGARRGRDTIRITSNSSVRPSITVRVTIR